MMESDGFSKLPQDVIFQILQKLPTRALLQFRCVAKSFVPLISHPHFVNLHLSAAAAAQSSHHLLYYESTDYTKTYFSYYVSGEEEAFRHCKTVENPFQSLNGYLRLVGCCGGVVCLFDTNYFTFVGTLILWNPFIGKFKILPRLDGFRDNLSHMAVGFGFDHRTADFKVVKVMYDECDSDEQVLLPKAYVYGVKIGCWRSIGPPAPCYMPKTWSSSVLVNGVVHWLSYKRPKFQGHPNCIMGFDLGEEVFRVMDLPRNLEPNFDDLRLSALVDETSIALFVECNGGNAWDMWLMSEHCVVESWVRIYSIVVENQVLFPLKILKNGLILGALRSEKLGLIDVEEGEVKEVEVDGLAVTFIVSGYSPTLALLDVGETLLLMSSENEKLAGDIVTNNDEFCTAWIMLKNVGCFGVVYDNILVHWSLLLGYGSNWDGVIKFGLGYAAAGGVVWLRDYMTNLGVCSVMELSCGALSWFEVCSNDWGILIGRRG